MVSNGAVIVSAVSLRTFGCRRSGPGDFDSFSDRSSSCTCSCVSFRSGHGVSTGCISHAGGFVSSFVKTHTQKSFNAIAFSSSLMALWSAVCSSEMPTRTFVRLLMYL